MYTWTGTEAPPDFDLELASTYIDKYILIGVTYFDHFGKELEQQQMHGIVEKVDATGFTIRLKGGREGETWNMPPVLEAISAANPGEYRLRTTGEVVVDPDLLTTWSVTKPCEN